MTIEQLVQNLLILLAALVGGIGLYALLPRGGRRGRRVGAVLALLAAGIVCAQLRPLGQLSASVVFYPMGGLALLGAAMTVTSRNPMYCALWFALVLLSTAGLFLLVGAQFLAAATVIVYAGAIVVTILFVIMLAQQQGLAVYDRVSHEPLLATLTSVALMAALTLTSLHATSEEIKPASDRIGQSALPSADTIARAQEHQPALRMQVPSVAPAEEAAAAPADVASGGLPPGHMAQLAGALVGENLIALEAAGALLLVALVGAATIATRHASAESKPAAPESGASHVAP